jgi:hypothetical protein
MVLIAEEETANYFILSEEGTFHILDISDSEWIVPGESYELIVELYTLFGDELTCTFEIDRVLVPETCVPLYADLYLTNPQEPLDDANWFIVDDMGEEQASGSIDIESPGVMLGTTVHLILPLNFMKRK